MRMVNTLLCPIHYSHAVKELTALEVRCFAQKGDLQLLGARTLEGMNLKVDSARKRLAGAGPVPAA